MLILLIFFVDDLVAPRIVAERLYKAQKDIPSRFRALDCENDICSEP